MQCAEPGCTTPLTGRQRKRCAAHRPNPFASDYRPYGTYEGARGTKEDWAEAFRQRFTKEQIEAIIGSESPWAILGLEPGATPEAIKAAFRRLARETHPDLNPGIDRAAFQRVQAAYETLTFY